MFVTITAGHCQWICSP